MLETEFGGRQRAKALAAALFDEIAQTQCFQAVVRIEQYIAVLF